MNHKNPNQSQACSFFVLFRAERRMALSSEYASNAMKEMVKIVIIMNKVWLST